MVTGTSLFYSDSWIYAASPHMNVEFVGFARVQADFYAWEKGLNFGMILSPFPGFYLSVFRGDGAYSRRHLIG